MWLPQFSNFHERAVSFDGDWYKSNEHAFQAAKTTDPDIRSQIRQCGSPGKAKRLGGPPAKGGLIKQLPPGWDEIRQVVMLDLCRQKFALPPLDALLLSTGNGLIVEENTWHDNVWGDCLCPECTNNPGQNLLGKILMKVRAELRQRNDIKLPESQPVVSGPGARIVIAGSRDVNGKEFKDLAFVTQKMDAVTAKISGPITVLSGKARGADHLGERWAELRNYPVIPFPANWTVLGQGAGMARNRQMIAQATHACFFWNGYSSGTKDAIEIAIKREIPVRVWTIADYI